MNDDANIIERAVCLCAVGAPDYLAARAVAADGSEHLVLVERSAIGDPTVRYDSTCRHVAHERLGRLPDAICERILPAPRCGRPTHAGTPCRQRVKATGQACGQHAARAAP